MDIAAIASVPKSTWPTMVMMVMLLKTKASQTWPMLGLSETEVCLGRGECQTCRASTCCVFDAKDNAHLAVCGRQYKLS